MTTINDIHDLHRILVEHPEWRSELRNILLTEELLALPQRFAEYSEVTDRRLDRIEEDISELKSDVKVLKDDVGELKGVSLENKLYHRAVPLTATYLDMYNGERIRVAEKDDNSAEFNDAIYKALSAGSFTKAEYNRIVDTDVIIRGSRIGDARPVYAAIEASYSLNNRDIDKVCQSATLIRRIFPNSEVHSVLYYMRRPNAEIEQEAVSRGVTLTVSRTLT